MTHKVKNIYILLRKESQELFLNNIAIKNILMI